MARGAFLQRVHRGDLLCGARRAGVWPPRAYVGQVTDDQGDDDVVSDLPEEESLTTSLRKALDSTPRLPRDRAAVRLAMHYAGLLDDLFDRLDEIGEHQPDDEGRDTGVADTNRLASLIAKIGPRYEATLDKLGMVPGARPATRGGDPSGTSPAAALLSYLQRGLTPEGFDPRAAVDPSVTGADAGD
jgi:hypothetical protein